MPPYCLGDSGGGGRDLTANDTEAPGVCQELSGATASWKTLRPLDRTGYNLPRLERSTLGIRLAVGRQTLNLLALVRIQDPQPVTTPEAHSSSGPGHRPLKAEIRGSNPQCATILGA